MSDIREGSNVFAVPRMKIQRLGLVAKTMLTGTGIELVPEDTPQWVFFEVGANGFFCNERRVNKLRRLSAQIREVMSHKNHPEFDKRFRRGMSDL